MNKPDNLFNSQDLESVRNFSKEDYAKYLAETFSVMNGFFNKEGTHFKRLFNEILIAVVSFSYHRAINNNQGALNAVFKKFFEKVFPADEINYLNLLYMNLFINELDQHGLNYDLINKPLLEFNKKANNSLNHLKEGKKEFAVFLDIIDSLPDQKIKKQFLSSLKKNKDIEMATNVEISDFILQINKTNKGNVELVESLNAISFILKYSKVDENSALAEVKKSESTRSEIFWMFFFSYYFNFYFGYPYTNRVSINFLDLISLKQLLPLCFVIVSPEILNKSFRNKELENAFWRYTFNREGSIFENSKLIENNRFRRNVTFNAKVTVNVFEEITTKSYAGLIETEEIIEKYFDVSIKKKLS